MIWISTLIIMFTFDTHNDMKKIETVYSGGNLLTPRFLNLPVS